jgi:hypothetical protein
VEDGVLSHAQTVTYPTRISTRRMLLALSRRMVSVKVFDPFTEHAVEQWREADPNRVIIRSEVFESSSGGIRHRVGVVFYDDAHNGASGVHAIHTNGHGR